MINRTESVKNKLVDCVTAKERLQNLQLNKSRQEQMRIAYAQRRQKKIIFTGVPA